jgi:hypothetical protein
LGEGAKGQWPLTPSPNPKHLFIELINLVEQPLFYI